MKFKEIKEKKTDELKKLLNEKKEDIRLQRFGGAGSKSRNVKAQMHAKKDIARILTFLNTKNNI